MNEELIRPDPDELLNIIKEEEVKNGRQTGHLKIFLGYVAGVGKTYKMLSEAHVLQDKHKDVVVGLAETHGRKETEKLLKDLEVIPRQKIEYKGISLEELDLDAVLKRKPEFVLIDELAHTNVPGVRHLKRYNDVEELLNAGINVYTTLNIQHIESINDIIRQVTGVEVKETVPDRIIEMANKIELVDLPIDELVERLHEGKVYIPEKAQQAMEQFFKRRNLVALRELSLRYATVHVDYDMEHYLKKENILGPWETSNRILVCISPNASSERLVRIAHRLADRFNAEWFAVYVEPSYSFNLKPEESRQLEKNLELVEKLDGRVFRLTGSISDEIVSFARSKNISLILMGHSNRTQLQELITGSVINQVIKKSDAQILVVENEFKRTTKSIKPDYDSHVINWKPYATSFLSIGLTLIICLLIGPFVEAINIPMIFIIPVVLTSLIAGRNAGILASLLAVAAFDFFFVSPFFTFTVDDLRFIPTFFVLFIVGIITSLLADTVKKQVEYTRQRESFIASLYDLSKDLLSSQDREDILEKSTKYISESFNYDVVILLPDKEKKLDVVSSFGVKNEFNERENGVATWVLEHGKEAGNSTETLYSSKWLHLPLKVKKDTVGVLSIATETNINKEQKHLIEAFASVISLALSNSQDIKRFI
jgi:two-component system sensor histidine kinase KdpD